MLKKGLNDSCDKSLRLGVDWACALSRCPGITCFRCVPFRSAPGAPDKRDGSAHEGRLPAHHVDAAQKHHRPRLLLRGEYPPPLEYPPRPGTPKNTTVPVYYYVVSTPLPWSKHPAQAHPRTPPTPSTTTW